MAGRMDWDRVHREKLVTKEVAPDEPTSWEPLPPLGGPDRQRRGRDSTKRSAKKAPTLRSPAAEEPLVLERKVTTPKRWVVTDTSKRNQKGSTVKTARATTTQRALPKGQAALVTGSTGARRKHVKKPMTAKRAATILANDEPYGVTKPSSAKLARRVRRDAIVTRKVIGTVAAVAGAAAVRGDKPLSNKEIAAIRARLRKARQKASPRKRPSPAKQSTDSQQGVTRNQSGSTKPTKGSTSTS